MQDAAIREGAYDRCSARTLALGPRRRRPRLRARFPRFAALPAGHRLARPRRLERDSLPGEQRRAYVEQFVLGELLAAARREVTDEQAKQYANILGRVSLGSLPFTASLSLH